MSQDPRHPLQDSQPLQVPGRTTPTWEIELLISGALVFSLFSLREPLEDYFISTLPVATELMQPLVMYSYLYGKLVLFVLMITFVLHLAARARWVALVGVHSIYPNGPRWENLSGGPLARKLSRRDCGDVAEAIERADNQASLVFGYGMLAAQLSLMIMGVSLVSFGGLALLRAAGVPQHYELWIISSFLGLLVLPMMLDKYVVTRLGEAHWLSRGTELLMRISFALTLSRMQQPLNSLITTNFGGKRGVWVLIGVIYVVLALATFDTMARMDRGPGIRGSALAETERDFGMLDSHYATRRLGARRHSTSPYIDSEVVRGPYLRLTIPYLSMRHDPVIAERCPEVPAAETPAANTVASAIAAATSAAGGETPGKKEEAEDTAARAEAKRAADQARVDCFGNLFAVQLDGVALQGLEFFRVDGGEAGSDGVMSMIDVRDLPRGRHTLRLEMVDGGRSKSKDDAWRPHLIEFWR